MAGFSAKKTGLLGPDDQFSGRIRGQSTGLFEGLFERIARRFGIQAEQKPVQAYSSCAQISYLASSQARSEGALASSLSPPHGLCPECEAPMVSDETCTECLWDWAIK